MDSIASVGLLHGRLIAVTRRVKLGATKRFGKIGGEALIVVGVQTMFEASPERFWNQGEKRQSQLVFIGKNLDEAKIRAGFQGCLIT